MKLLYPDVYHDINCIEHIINTSHIDDPEKFVKLIKLNRGVPYSELMRVYLDPNYTSQKYFITKLDESHE